MKYLYKLSSVLLLMSCLATPLISDADTIQKETELTDPVQTESSNELVVNGNFEESLSIGWQGLQSFSLSNDVAEDSKGTQSLKIETASQVNLIFTDNAAFFPLKVGEKYIMKVKIKAEKMDFNSLSFRLIPADAQWNDKEKLVVTSPKVKWGVPQVKIGEWITVEKEILIAEGFGKGNKNGDVVSSKIFIQGSKNSSKTVLLLDDISITPVNGIAATVTPKTKVAAGKELLINGNFEDGLSNGWYGLKDFEQSKDISSESNGARSLKIVTTEQIKIVATTKDAFFPLEVGKSYTFKGRVKGDKINFNALIIRLMPGNAQWHDKEKVTLTKPSINWGDTKIKEGEWVTFEKVLTIEEGFGKGNKNGDVVPAKVLMQTSPVQEKSVFYLDDISIIEVESTNK
ncbi:hypothetical protein EI427_17665 [Flammeovirga pectinis]|uniref:CBM-cenC domain-containing protein n=1 Tax=Flammeovirga pectinis TaxID=2494373 RepID=A0A3S9P6Z5_9BACT|nr:hypothetical protein [Flammeovirga pectinis]AZQ63985.1 hypothetical protein EI427_17665 [Flammeovirga pectinis]